MLNIVLLVSVCLCVFLCAGNFFVKKIKNRLEIVLITSFYYTTKRNVKHLLLRKTDVLKTSISQKENLKKCNNFKEQNSTRYIRENVYIGIIAFSCLSSTKPCLRFLLNCFFFWEIEGFYQSSFGNDVNFRELMSVFLNILAKN